jgi:hypothetical protein
MGRKTVVFTVAGEMVEMNVMDGRFSEERFLQGAVVPNLGHSSRPR